MTRIFVHMLWDIFCQLNSNTVLISDVKTFLIAGKKVKGKRLAMLKFALYAVLAVLAKLPSFSGYQPITCERSIFSMRDVSLHDKKISDDNEEYTNKLTAFLGKFISKGDNKQLEIPELVNSVNWSIKKCKGLTLSQMRKRLDDALRKDGWFVTGNVDPSLFSDSFSFQDPDVKIKGIKAYSDGVRKIFNQKISKAEIISTSINDTLSNTITVTWRLEGAVNIGPGLRIKPYIVYTNLRVSKTDGLIEFQEDLFSIPGTDILLSALFPFLQPFLSPPAPAIEVLREKLKNDETKSSFKFWK
eukprot:gene8572-17682_t